MLANDLKETRSQFLEGKTELTNEDIIHLLDLSPEKTAANIEIYTEKSYKELKGNPEELARLTKELTSAEYLRYKETFISKSKLLYEQSSVLYNEIPCLIVLNEIKIPSYLLPYEYAKNKQGDTRHFADSLKENAFTDFKRLFNLRLKHSFDKGLEQGRDIFFLVNNEKLDKEEIKKQLEKLIKFHKGSDKQGLFLFYSEKDYKCFSFESDYSGKITENNDYDLKKLRLAISDKPFTPNLERTNTNERPRSSNLNISPSNMSVNELFYSLLKRGEITALATLKDLSDRENRYYEAVSDMERTNNTIFSDFLKKSNTAFLLKEKQSRFYKDILKIKLQGDRTMEKEKIEIQTYKFQNGETIDEILSKQTSWATDEELTDYFAEYAPKEDLLNVINFSNWTYFNSEKISTKVYDVEISASLYEQLLPSEYKERSIKEDEVVCIQYRKSVLSEEQDQFLIEKFDKNNFMLLQQKEIQIDVELKNKIKSICNSYIEPQNNNSYTDEILDKIRAAGIEVVTDKDEFDRILTEKTNGRPDIALNQLYHDKFDEYKIQKMALSKGVLESLTEIGNTIKNDSAMILKSPSFGDVTFSTGVFGDLSKKNNGGYGINHIVEGRYVKDGLTQQDIASLLYLIKDAVETTTVEIDDSKSRQNIIKDGIWVTVRKDFDGIKQNWIVTGFAENDEKGQITKEATDAIKAVNAQYGYAPEHLFVSEQVGAVIASLNNVAQNILMSSNEERIKNFKEVYKNTQFLDSVIKNENTFTKEATDTIQTVIARNSYALEHSSIREQVGAVIDSIPLANEKSTIINNNEKSQENHSNAKEYMIQTTRLFLSMLKEKELPFLKGKKQGSIIIIKPQAVRDAATGKAFTGYPQLMAQALIQAVYEQKKIPELEYDLITYDQAKACGTFIKKGSPHITLTNYNPATNAASKQMYYFKSGCNSPEIIDLHRENLSRYRAIKKSRQTLDEKDLSSEQQIKEKNKITLLHYEELTYLKSLKKDTEQYINSLPAEEKNMLTELCKKTPLTQKTVKELAETLRKDRLISTQLSLQKNSERYFDATECIVPEDFIAKAMAAASLGCSLETTEKTIDSITKDLHQTLSKNIDHYDYGKAFEVGEVITEKCIKNCKEMKNQEYEAAELAKKLEQKQQELKKNPINLLMELLNKNDLSNRTIGGYER